MKKIYKGYTIELHPMKYIGDFDMFSIDGYMGVAPYVGKEYKKGDDIYIGVDFSMYTDRHYDLMIEEYKYFLKHTK